MANTAHEAASNPPSFVTSTNISEEPFSITIAADALVYHLLEAIKSYKKDVCAHVLAIQIVPWTLKEQILEQDVDLSSMRYMEDIQSNCEEMSVRRPLKHYFPSNPLDMHIHVIIEIPDQQNAPRHSFRSLQDLYNPPKIELKQDVITFRELVANDIKCYLEEDTQLAHFESRTNSNAVQQHLNNLHIPVISSSQTPSLLLHNLGHNHDPRLLQRIEALYDRGAFPRFLCNTSGSGKTRLLLEGLCLNWGLYFTARKKPDNIGSENLETVLNACREDTTLMPRADDKQQPEQLRKSSVKAHNRFHLVLFCHLFIFRIFLETAKSLPGGITEAHKKRWLLLQISPSLLKSQNDPFVHLAERCEKASQGGLSTLVATEFWGVISLVGRVFCVLDEVQAISESESSIRSPILPEIRFAWRLMSDNLILSGTAMPSNMEEEAVRGSSVAKDPSTMPIVTDTGSFDNEDHQRAYLEQYLPSGYLDTADGKLLATRVGHWLHGRYGFTAAYVSQLIETGFERPHWALNEFVYDLTSFRPTEYEEESPPTS